jgi:hypothetical protein
MAICGEALLVGTDGELRPRKTFLYHDFKDCLFGLLSRRDIKAVMDQACNNLMDSINSPHLSFVKTPFEAQFLCQFSGPQPGSHFVDRGEEGHYVFALHVDFFNPEGLNIHGASTSCRIISMACLNLPLDIRYKLENMYLAGLIPGPKQLSLENLNHYIHPLINDLVDAWQHGIKFSNTTCYPHGRLIHSAVTAVVCDLPAARQIASMAGVGSHFYCSACNCYHKSTCGRVNFKKWEPQDREKLQEYAEQWRDAATSSEHERLFKAHGMRYSKLWCLLYWDPSQRLVIDPMHCILEGLVQHHTQNLLSLTSESITSTSPSPAFACDFGEVPRTMTAKELTQTSVIRTLLISHIGSGNDQQVEECFDKLKSTLSHKNSGPLKFACSSLHCMPQKVGRTLKIDHVKALVNWVSSSL